MSQPPLVDGFGRTHRSLRLSVTDRCNLRCRYCMPAEGMDWLPREELLSYEELERIVRLLAAFGVSEVRVTGGEPLVRAELPRLIGRLAAVPGVREISLTTNGVLLERSIDDLVAAGLDRVNVSVDSLDPDRFERITRRRDLDRVLAAWRRASATRGCGRSRSTPSRCAASASRTSCRWPSSRAAGPTWCASSR